MSVKTAVLHAVQRTASGAHALAGAPFDPETPFHPPRGRYTTVHYGLMFPNLPAPLNFLDIIAVVGQPYIKLWRNGHLIRTTGRDTASLLVGSAVTFPGQFRGYSVSEEMELAADSSVVRFGSDLSLEGSYPDFTLTYDNPACQIAFDIRATDRIAHFAKVRGGLYDHWSLLCEYAGTVRHDGTTYELSGLSTLEYARGTPLTLGFTFFTYQIINVDERTQVLMVEVLGPASVSVQQAVYVRSLDDHGGVYEDGFRFDVFDVEPEPRTTPNGLTMELGTRFEWSVDDENGDELISIDGTTNDDYIFG
ncbi:DUF6670 family protein, partial [Rhodococcus triatomae]